MSGTTGLALASLRHRTTASVATFAAVFLGTAMIGSFATLAETATGPVSAADRDTLTIMGAVIGGWGSVIVLFSVVSTLTITVRQRHHEIALIRTIGGTPRQARRLIRAEVLLVTLAAAVGGALVAAASGRGLLAVLRNGGLVGDDVGYGGGVVSLTAAALLVTVVSLVAATIAARRATRGPAALTLREAIGETGRMRWWRIAIGLLLVGYGVGMAAVTILVTADSSDPYDAMATSGSSSILVGVGLAVFAPVLLRLAAGPSRALLGRSGPGHLAAAHAARRSHLLAGVLAPVIVLTSSSIGTLMLVGIDHRTLMPGADTEDIGDTINLLNNLVVGMLSLFAAIMVVNAFAAVISQRRTELRRLWLLGATPEEVRRSVVAEAVVVAVLGVVVGGIASLATVVPFAVARDEGLVPDGQLWLPALIAVATVALTIGAARGAVRPVLRTLAARPAAAAG